MKDYEIKQVVGVCAYDGTVFRFDGGLEKAKEECKKYEQSAKMIVLSRLEGVLIKQPLGEITSKILNEDGTVKTPAPENYYMDDSLSQLFGYYDSEKWLFHPTKQEDIENLLMYIDLQGCDINYIRKQLKVGEYYTVMIDTDERCAMVVNREIVMAVVENALNREEAYAKAFFNPDEYNYVWDEETGEHFAKKED